MGKLGAFSNVEAPLLGVVQVQVLVNLEAKAKEKVKGFLYLGVYGVFGAF